MTGRDYLSEHTGILKFLFAAVEGFCLSVPLHSPEVAHAPWERSS